MSKFRVLLLALSVVHFTSIAESQTVSAGELGGPRYLNSDRPTYFTLGAGPAFSTGLNADELMIDFLGSVNHSFSDYFTGKVIGDFILGSGSNTARFITAGVGADIYARRPTDTMRPYLSVDGGAGFARNSESQTKDAAQFGIGAGFRTSAEIASLDLSLQYRVLSAQLNGATPSVLSVRVAGNF